MEINVSPPATTQEAGGTPPAAPPGGERPDWLPQQFQSGADMAKSYTALQAEYTKLKQGGGNETPPADPPPAGETGDTPPADPPAQQTGNPIDDAMSYWTQHGELTDDHYAALEKAGIGRQVVDGYISGQTSAAEAQANQIIESIGGQDEFTKMTEWMRSNLTVADIEAYNNLVNGSDATAAQFAVQAMHARFKGGQEPTLLTGDTNTAANNDTFASHTEMVKAMSDDRYGVDPAYTKQVEDKTARSRLMRG